MNGKRLPIEEVLALPPERLRAYLKSLSKFDLQVGKGELAGYREKQERQWEADPREPIEVEINLRYWCLLIWFHLTQRGIPHRWRSLWCVLTTMLGWRAVR